MYITQALSLILPLLFAGVMFIVILKKQYFRFLDSPIDAGVTVGGQPLFGRNKTWRGVLSYYVLTTIICVIFWAIGSQHTWLHEIYKSNPFILGVFFASAYVIGELLNSFIKRRLNIAPGSKTNKSGNVKIQKMIDNFDGIFTVSIGLLLVYGVTWHVVFTAALMGILAHIATELYMRRTGLKKQ